MTGRLTPRPPAVAPVILFITVSPDMHAESMQRRDSYCYPVTYGTSCVAHDIVEPPYCGIRDDFGVRSRDFDIKDPKPFCRDSWCYVDPEVRDAACSQVELREGTDRCMGGWVDGWVGGWVGGMPVAGRALLSRAMQRGRSRDNEPEGSDSAAATIPLSPLLNSSLLSSS